MAALSVLLSSVRSLRTISEPLIGAEQAVEGRELSRATGPRTVGVWAPRSRATHGSRCPCDPSRRQDRVGAVRRRARPERTVVHAVRVRPWITTRSLGHPGSRRRVVTCQRGWRAGQARLWTGYRCLLQCRFYRTTKPPWVSVSVMRSTTRGRSWNTSEPRASPSGVST